MTATGPDRELTLTAGCFGARDWARVRRAAWQATPLDDPALSAAAELVARQERHGACLAAIPFGVLALMPGIRRLGYAATAGLASVAAVADRCAATGPAAGPPRGARRTRSRPTDGLTFLIGLVGITASVSAWFRLRRAISIHAAQADHEALTARIHDPLGRSDTSALRIVG